MAIAGLIGVGVGALTGGGSGSSVGSSTGGGSGFSVGSATGSGDALGGLLGGFMGIFDQIENLFSCWGVTWKPNRAKEFINTQVPIFQNDVQLAIQSSNVEQKLNQVIKSFHQKYVRDNAWLLSCTNPPEGCSKKTLESLIPTLLQAEQQILTQAKSQFEAQNSGKQLVIEKTSTNYSEFGFTAAGGCQIMIEHYKVTVKNSPVSIINQPIAETVSKIAFAPFMFFLVIGTLVYQWYKSRNSKPKFKNSKRVQ